MAFIKDTNRSRGVGAIAAVDGVTQRRIQQRRQANRIMALNDRRMALETRRAFGAVDQRGTSGGGAGGGGTAPLRLGARIAPATVLSIPATVATKPPAFTIGATKASSGASIQGSGAGQVITDPVLTASGGGSAGAGASAAPPPSAADATPDAVDPSTLFPPDDPTTTLTTPDTTATTGPNWLLWGGIAVGAYLLWQSHKET